MPTSARAHLCEVDAQVFAIVTFTACMQPFTKMSMRDMTCSVNESRSNKSFKRVDRKERVFASVPGR